MFSKACEYGIKSIIYISMKSLEGQRVKIGEVAAHINSPEAFTAKILGLLVRHQIVESHTGPSGGFQINTTTMTQTPLSTIVNIIDGDQLYHGCGLGLTQCNELAPCPLHERFAAIRLQLKNMLESTTLLDLAIGLKEGKSVLFN